MCLSPALHATPPLQINFVAAQSVLSTSSLSYPYRVAVDAGGSVYISDTQGNRVLKETWVPATHSYSESVVTSSGLATPYGVAVDSSGNVYIADNGHNRVVVETYSAGSYTQSVMATTTSLSYPTGVAVDSSGSVYIADTGRGKILKETPSGGGNFTETVVSSSVLLAQITGIAVDSSGNVFVSDIDNWQVYELAYSAGSYTISTVPTSGLNYPYDLAVDANDNLYINDFTNKRVVKETYVSPGNYSQSVFPTANIGGSLGIAVDASGNIYLADTFGQSIKEETLAGADFNQVQVGSASGTDYLFFNFTGGFNGDTVGLDTISVLTQGATGLDFASAATEAGSCSTTATYNIGDSCFVAVKLTAKYPGWRMGAVVLTGTGGTPNSAHSKHARPLSSSPALSATAYMSGIGIGPQVNFQPGTVLPIAGPGNPTNLANPFGVAVDASGNVYVTDYNNNAAYKETLSAGSYTQTTIATGLSAPQGIAVDGAGNVYIVDSGNNQILKETLSAGTYTQSAVATSLNFPTGVTVDGVGNVYFTSFNDGAVYEEKLSNGVYSPVTAVTGLNEPRNVAVDPSGNLYIADTGNSQVVKETLSGGSYTQSTIGSGQLYPYDVRVGASGVVFIADTVNRRILEETPSGGSYTQSVVIPGPTAYGLQVDQQGNIFLSNAPTEGVYEISFQTPPNFSFAPTVIGSTSSDSPQSFTAFNAGNADLTFPVPDAGTNADISGGSGSFVFDASNTCPAVTPSGSAGTLSAGDSCVYAIDFVPTASGALTATLNLIDNSLNQENATQSGSLSGTGLGLAGYGITGLPANTTAGTHLPFTLTAKVNGGATFTEYTGTALLTSSDPQASFSLTAGGAAITSYTFTGGNAGVMTLYVTLGTAGLQTITAQDNVNSLQTTSGQVSVAAGPAAIIASEGKGKVFHAVIGDPMVDDSSNPAKMGVLVTDAYQNPVQGVTVTYTAPSSGASLRTASFPLVTDENGLTHVTAFANGTAGGPYSVTAAAADLSGSPVTFTLTNLADTSTAALTASPADSVVYTHAVTLEATVSPSATVFSVGPPTGTVSFYDTVNSTPRLLGTATVGGSPGGSPNDATGSGRSRPECAALPASNPGPKLAHPMGGGCSPGIPATASLVISAPAGGAHSYTASYSADTNFTASAASAVSYTVSEAPVTVAGPVSQPILFTPGVAGSIPVTVTGPATGAGIVLPSGSVAFTLLDGSRASVASGTVSLTAAEIDSTATVPIGGSIAPGNYTLDLSYAGDTNYAASESPATVSITVSKITSTIAWLQPSPISYGTSLAGLLDATASHNSTPIAGTFAYTATPTEGSASAVTAGTILPAGSYTLGVTFTPTNGSTYTTATGSVSLTVSKGAPTVAWPQPSGISYGTSLAAILDATAKYNAAAVPGAFAYTATPNGGSASAVTASTVLGAGSYTLNVTFTPTDAADYTGATGSVSLTVSKGAPTLNWPQPSGINYGTSLGAILDATAKYNSAAVAGTYAYTATPSGGSASTVTASTVLGAGGYMLNVSFTPTDTADYTTATGSVSLTVSKGAPTLNWPQPSGISYGTSLAAILDATAKYNAAAVPGAFAYTATPSGGSASGVTSSTVLGAGSYTLNVTFTPTDTADYATATGSVSLAVSKGAPTLNWPQPSGITYGTSLGAILDASAKYNSAAVAGTYAYTATPSGGSASAVTASTVLGAGSYTLNVSFTPTDTADYTTATGSVSLAVSKGAPTVVWPRNSGIIYGSSLGAVLDATARFHGASVPGTFAYTATSDGPAESVTASTVLGAGTYTLYVDFAPADTADYTLARGSVTLIVSKGPPALNWPQPSGISYGTSLTAILDATAKYNGAALPGAFAYTATPNGGSASTVTASTVLAAGSYTLNVSFTPTDTADYTAASGSVSLTVSKGAPTVTWAQPSGIPYGTSLGGVLDATAKDNGAAVPGAFAYTAKPSGGSASAVTASTVLGAGNYVLTVTFTPTDSADYTPARGSVSLAVEKAAASIVLASSTNPQFVQDAVTFTATVSSSVGTPGGQVSFLDGTSLLGSVALASGSAAYTTSSLAKGTHSVTAVYSGSQDYAAATSPAVSEVIQDFALSISTADGGSASATAAPGGTAIYPLVFKPVDGSKFPNAVDLTLSGLPPGATGTLTPDTLPANSGTTPVTLTVKLSEPSAQSLPPGSRRPFAKGGLPLVLGLLLIPFAGRLRSAARKLRGLRSWSGLVCLAVLGLVSASSVLLLAGCGGTSTGYFGQAPQTYTLTITGTSGALSHSTTVTLTVQ